MIRTLTIVSLAIALAFPVGCRRPEPVAEQPAAPTHVFEVIAKGLEFSAPDRTESGWTTIRLRNESPMTHFALLEKYPEGVGIDDMQKEVAPVFQQGMDLLNQGDEAGAMAKFGELPAWFGEIVLLGGPGLTGAGVISEVTLRLEPGTYLLECYVKTGGVFHSYSATPGVNGMVHQFTVTAEVSPAPEPTSTLAVTLSSARGIEVAGAPVAGPQTIAVRFEDQKQFENFGGLDLHLARLAEETDLEAVAAWMDWRAPHGLESPAPVQFLGGVNDMPAGSTAYLRFDLEPGRYAWIAEVPDAGAKSLLKTFTVAGP